MGKKNKFDKIERNETYYEAYGEEEVKEKKKQFVLGLDKNNVPEKKPLSSKFTYTKEKKEQAREVSETEEKAEIEKPHMSPYVLTLIVVCLAFVMQILARSSFLFAFVQKNSLVASIVMYAGVYLVPSVIFMIFTFGRMRFHYVKKVSLSYLPFSFASLGLVLSLTALQKYIIAYTFSYSEPTAVSFGGAFAGIFVGALLPAVCEELFIHGVLQKEVTEYAGGFAGILVSAFVFAMLHFELQYFFVYFVAAIIMGALTHVTRSCFPAMLVHFLNNTLSILFAEKLGFIAAERIGGRLLMIIIAAVCFGFLILCLNIAEKISEKRADAAAENSDSADEPVHFFSKEKGTFTRTLEVIKTPPMLISFAVFVIAAVLSFL